MGAPSSRQGVVAESVGRFQYRAALEASTRRILPGTGAPRALPKARDSCDQRPSRAGPGAVAGHVAAARRALCAALLGALFHPLRRPCDRGGDVGPVWALSPGDALYRRAGALSDPVRCRRFGASVGIPGAALRCPGWRGERLGCPGRPAVHLHPLSDPGCGLRVGDAPGGRVAAQDERHRAPGARARKGQERADLRRRRDGRAAARGPASHPHLHPRRLRRSEPDAVGPNGRRPQGSSSRAHGRPDRAARCQRSACWPCPRPGGRTGRRR